MKNRRIFMTTSEQVRVLCIRSDVDLLKNCKKIGQTPQKFNTKLKRNTINQEELEKKRKF